MTRHARNCTAGAVYTYHEKKKDTQQSGYGSKNVRLGKDSVRQFDCCCLTLQPCENPVITPDGFLYDKEAILENILHQKKENARKMKEFEKQKKKEEQEMLELGAAEQASKLQKFSERGSVVIGKDKSTEPEPGSSVSNMIEGKDKALPSFWVPTLTPQATETKLTKPKDKVICPMSGKPLKLKDLIDIKFTPIKDEEDKRSLIVKDARYVCAVTNDVLGNSVPCVVLRTSGNVVTQECVDKLLRKDMIDPTNSKPLKEADIIPLQRGATGFSGAGIGLQAKKEGPAMMS